jgi:hypothetical protein
MYPGNMKQRTYQYLQISGNIALMLPLKNCIYVSIFDSSKQAILGNNFMQIFHTPYYGVTIHAQLATYA